MIRLRIRPGTALAAVIVACLGAATLPGVEPRQAAQRSTPSPGPAEAPDYVPPEVQRLAARTVRAYDAPEADQGVAVDRQSFYPVDNSVLARYDLMTGQLLDRWAGPRNGPVRHLNSCLVREGRLWCANSNYPETPMGSSIEVFDPATLDHVETHSLGLMEEGSLTWVDGMANGWIAGFAHYSGNGGVPFKDQRFSGVVTFDERWRRTGGWLMPAAVVERMAPHAASGGAIGPDGWLYLLGHDRPELYVVGKPAMGPTLVHLATIEVEAEGQAFSWAHDGTRQIFAIDRRRGRVLRIDVPAVARPEEAVARPFR